MPATQPANTGTGAGGTGANTGAGGYSVTISPNGQMIITQGGRPVYTGPVQGTSLTYNQSGQLVGFNAPKSSPITTTAQPSAPAQSSPAASSPTSRAGAWVMVGLEPPEAPALDVGEEAAGELWAGAEG